MAQNTLPTTHDYTKRAISFERQLQSLERQRNDILEQIEACKSPTNMFLALFAPLHRRSVTLEVRHLRREISRIELQMLDLKAEQAALHDEQQQYASVLEENTRLCEQEVALHREYRWLALQEDQLELKRRKATLEKVLEQDRLREEARQLQQQQRELQKQLNEVREKLGENRQRREQVEERLQRHTVHSSDTQVYEDEAGVSKISVVAK
jgi:chromosome segregation ATPase